MWMFDVCVAVRGCGPLVSGLVSGYVCAGVCVYWYRIAVVGRRFIGSTRWRLTLRLVAFARRDKRKNKKQGRVQKVEKGVSHENATQDSTQYCTLLQVENFPGDFSVRSSGIKRSSYWSWSSCSWSWSTPLGNN